MKTIATISTYGMTDYGAGHDTETAGSIKDQGYRISTKNGTKDFTELLIAAVKHWDLRRGDKIVISIEPFST